MEKVSQLLRTDINCKIIDFCGEWIPIYEAKVRRRGLASLTQRMRRATRNHFQEREQVARGRLRWAWSQIMEAVERLTRAQWITMHIFDMDEEEALLMSLFSPYYIEAGEYGAGASTSRISGAVGRPVIYRGATNWIGDNAIKFGKKYAHSVSDTTNHAIRDEIADAIRQGEGIDKVMDRIASVYRDAEGYRSEMIARTEMSRAYNASALEQSKAFGITQFDWDGCDPACPICGPFLGGPHTAEEIGAFIGATHPNCMGTQIDHIPEDFEPNELF